MIYYNSVVLGEVKQGVCAYDTLINYGYNGPVTAVVHLPKISQWSNVNLKNNKRAILTEIGTDNVKEKKLPNAFNYENYAARFLTTQEVQKACNLSTVSKISGEINSCNYLLENTGYASYNPNGYMLENYSTEAEAWNWVIDGTYVGYMSGPVSSSQYSVRPAIEVSKINIDY